MRMGIPGITTHQVHKDDRCVYWFYLARLVPAKLRCDRAEFVKALASELAALNKAGPNTLAAYLRNVRLALYDKAQQIYLEAGK